MRLATTLSSKTPHGLRGCINQVTIRCHRKTSQPICTKLRRLCSPTQVSFTTRLPTLPFQATNLATTEHIGGMNRILRLDSALQASQMDIALNDRPICDPTSNGSINLPLAVQRSSRTRFTLFRFVFFGNRTKTYPSTRGPFGLTNSSPLTRLRLDGPVATGTFGFPSASDGSRRNADAPPPNGKRGGIC